MAVSALTAFPSSIVSGDTLRVTYSDSDYPSGTWTLAVVFRGPVNKTFTATAGASNAHSLEVSAADTAKLTPGSYDVTFVYTHTDGERITEPLGKVEVAQDPARTGADSKSIARQTLEAMEEALLKLSSGTNASVNFNGQSMTKRNIPEMQRAIAEQRETVNREDRRAALANGTHRSTGIATRFGRNCYADVDCCS